MAKEAKAVETDVKADPTGDEGNKILASKTELPDGGVAFSDSNAKAPDVVLDPLFDDEEDPSIDELKEVDSSDIISSEKKGAETSPPTDDEKAKEAEEAKAKVEAEAKEKAEADARLKAESETADKDKDKGEVDDKGVVKPPPRGFVPLQALRESRTIESDLRQENANLKRQIEEGIRAIPDDSTGKVQQENIKTLADKLNDLKKLKDGAVDDPVATIQQTIDAVVDTISDIQSSVQDKAEASKADVEYKDVVDRGFRQMESFVPGVFDESKGVNKSLSEFAVKNGLSNEFLEIMTHPGTTVLGPDGEARYIGNDAALFTLFLSNANGLAQAGTEDALKEREKEIRAEVEKELTKKFLLKSKSGDTDFKSIGDLPGDTDVNVEGAFSADTVLSEADFARLSEPNKEKYLKM